MHKHEWLERGASPWKSSTSASLTEVRLFDFSTQDRSLLMNPLLTLRGSFSFFKCKSFTLTGNLQERYDEGASLLFHASTFHSPHSIWEGCFLDESELWVLAPKLE
jgi:hypothetical protein